MYTCPLEPESVSIIGCEPIIHWEINTIQTVSRMKNEIRLNGRTNFEPKLSKNCIRLHKRMKNEIRLNGRTDFEPKLPNNCIRLLSRMKNMIRSNSRTNTWFIELQT